MAWWESQSKGWCFAGNHRDTERERERWQPLTLDKMLSEDDVIIKNKHDVIFFCSTLECGLCF